MPNSWLCNQLQGAAYTLWLFLYSAGHVFSRTIYLLMFLKSLYVTDILVLITLGKKIALQTTLGGY